MGVQYQGGTAYLCNYLRQPYRGPGCQYGPAAPVDIHVVTACVAALSPVTLDMYPQAMRTQQREAARRDAAQRQHLERLRYAATRCERQFRRVDPDNR